MISDIARRMTPAEFDTRRRVLGLSIAELSEIGRRVNEKTVRRWIAGTTPIPIDAINDLVQLKDAMHRKAKQLVDTMTERSLAGPITLLRYRTQYELDEALDSEELPLGAHAIYTSWAAEALAAEGIDVVIEWADTH